jgi:ABC-type sugar transport system substrate-binding protein
MDRIEGFRSIMDSAPGIQIVTVQPAYGRRDLAITVTENILQANPDIDALFATADAMALGALSVVESLSREKPMILVGFDACEEAIQAILKGTLQADIAQFPDQMGRMFIENALKVVRKEAVPERIPIPVELVTAENAASFAAQ